MSRGSAAGAAPVDHATEASAASGNDAGWRVSIVDETLVLDADNHFVATTFINRADYSDSYEKRAAVALQIAALPDLLVALREAAEQFERYAASHRAKGTPEADAKAATNDRWATYMRAALTKAGG